jgi:hypothetical protein
MCRRMSWIPGFCVILFMALVCHVNAQDTAPEGQDPNDKLSVDGDRILSYIKWMARDEMQGRKSLTEGYNQAAKWAGDKFKRWGLKPAGQDDTYFQDVPVERNFTYRTGTPEVKVANRTFLLEEEDFALHPLSTAATRINSEFIILGGHMDHVGMRNGLVYNGADDNASGTAVVMEVARVLSEAKYQPQRTIIFCCWCAEELGLLGSKHYVDNPCDGVTMDQVVTYFNMDTLAPTFQQGPARFDTLFAYFKDANPDLFTHLEAIKQWHAQGHDHWGVSYVAGTSGVGKSYVVRNLDMFDKTVTQTIKLNGLFADTEPDLQSLDKEVVFNRLPGAAVFDVQSVLDVIDPNKAFVLLDDLDEVHEHTVVMILKALEQVVAKPQEGFKHFVVFGRPESFWPWLHDSKRSNLPQVTPTPIILQGPEYLTSGDAVCRCQDYYGFKFSKPAPKRVTDDVVNQLSRFPFLRDTIRPLSAGNFVLDDSVARKDTGTELLNTADALKQRLFEQLMARNQESHGRPDIDNPVYLNLLRQAAALPWTHNHALDKQGFFEVSEKDTLFFTDDQGQPHKVRVRDVLNRCGLVTLDVTNAQTTRYRFEPFWVQAFLVACLD